MQDELNFLYQYNNGYDENEALNHAIYQSLDEELIPPSRRHPEDFFQNYENVQTDPVSEKIYQVLSMVKSTRTKINELVNLDITSNPQNKQPKKEENLSDSQKLRRQQDIEYQEVLKRAQEKEKADEIRMKEEKGKADEINNYAEMIKQKFKEIGDEPKNGILLAVTLPDGKRLQRNFSPKSFGSDVYIWVAANEQIISSGLHLGDFNLSCATNIVLIDKKTLNDQKIISRTIFSVIETK